MAIFGIPGVEFLFKLIIIFLLFAFLIHIAGKIPKEWQKAGLAGIANEVIILIIGVVAIGFVFSQPMSATLAPFTGLMQLIWGFIKGVISFIQGMK